MDVLPFVALLLAALLMVLGSVVWMLRRQVRRVHARWAADGLVMRRGPVIASYRGHARGGIPLRGNGTLALTQHDVRFSQLVPRREFVIPLNHITRVALHRSWRGSTRVGMPVMAIFYHADQGEDAIGLAVRDVRDWMAAIAAAAQVPVDEA